MTKNPFVGFHPTLYGGELSYQGHSYFSGFDVSYWGNYSYVDGKIDYIYDYPLPYSASHIFKAGSTLRYSNWRFSPSMRWASPIMAAPYDNGKLARVGGYCIANLYASYDITQSMKVSLTINNLFDDHYYGVRYNSSSKYLSPQDTRMISGMLTINF